LIERGEFLMMNYYARAAAEFSQHSKIQFNFVETHADLCRVFARELVDLIKAQRAQGKMAVVILPVGPLDFGAFAELCNQENVSCESLVIISMDEYCDANDKPIPFEHPASFRAFYQHDLMDRLDRDKKLPPNQLALPNPDDLGLVQRTIEKFGGVDIVYGGLGINGHFAFNLPQPPRVDLETFKNMSVRVIELSGADIAQMAIGGTGGNLEIIPPKACTVGMKELLGAKKIHLTFMRSWHAGVLRRALFGPVTPTFPGSLVQLHPNVTATITSIAAQLPPFSILQQSVK
jgi:glucosamine-6-phosphate deaminase